LKQINTVLSHHDFIIGAEYRSFLLYWGAIVLRGILDEDRYLHFLLLCSAITLFLGLSITEDDVRLGEEMIYIYLRMYPHLYSKRRRHFLGGMQPGH